MITPKLVGYYPRVLLAFARLNNDALIPFVQNVINSMSNNPHYATPTPTLAAVLLACDNLVTLISESLMGGRLSIAYRNDAREQLLTLMRALAAYVTSVCQEDVTILLTSGFDPVKAPSPVGVLSAPTNLRLSYNGMHGEFAFRFDAIKNARTYGIEVAEVIAGAEGPWISQGNSTSSRVTIKDLIPGKEYRVRSCANGSAGASEWSVFVEMMAV